ncbi:MAG: hypothetical protein ACP5XB_25515, partial [Isosphaeraceae bacterium]
MSNPSAGSPTKQTFDQILMDNRPDWQREPLSVVVHFALALDIGDEINLEQARTLIQGELGQLPRRKRTPESLGYRPAPIRVPLEPVGMRLPGEITPARPPRAELTLF